MSNIVMKQRVIEVLGRISYASIEGLQGEINHKYASEYATRYGIDQAIKDLLGEGKIEAVPAQLPIKYRLK